MAEHTPTPWTVAHRKGQAVIRGPSTECLAALPYAPCEGYGLMDVFEVGANAAFIVKAVNNHDALVKTLEAIDDLDEQGRLGRIAREALDALLPSAADVRGILGGLVGNAGSGS